MNADLTPDTAPDVGAAARAVSPAVTATLEAWRAQGAHRHDPVRFRFIESLARRAAAHEGETRRLLDDKLAQAMAAYGAQHGEHVDASDAVSAAKAAEAPAAASAAMPAVRSHAVPRALPPSPTASIAKPHAQPRVQRPAPTTATASPAAQRPAPPRGALAELVDHIARQPPPTEADPASTGSARKLQSAPTELKTLQYFRSTWTRLSADQRVTQALAKVPENAGPLNSQHLVHRALNEMRDLSPAYLHRFMPYVDTLLWLDQAQIAVPAGKDAARGDGVKKAGRGRSG